MSDARFSTPDPPACPFLGMLGDPRTHFTFPNPAHRCSVSGRAKEIDSARQARFCLGTISYLCERYRADRLPAPMAVPVAPAPVVTGAPAATLGVTATVSSASNEPGDPPVPVGRRLATPLPQE